MKEKCIYYAHHLFKYNTKIEEYEVSLIKSNLPQYKIINPNGDINHKDMSDNPLIMKECLECVSSCAALAFSSINGVVGKGVYDEVNHAFDLNKKVYYIFNDSLIPLSKVEFKIIYKGYKYYAIVEKYIKKKH